MDKRGEIRKEKLDKKEKMIEKKKLKQSKGGLVIKDFFSVFFLDLKSFY